MNVNFRLTRPNNEKSGVKLDFSNSAFKNNRFLYGCRLKVITRYWNPSTQRLRLVSYYSGEAAAINKRLDSLKAKVLSYVDENDILSKEGLRDHLNKESGVTAKKEQAKINRQPAFIAWAESHTKNRSDISVGRKKGIMSTVNFIKGFQPQIKIEDIDRNFFKRLMLYMDAEGYHQNYKWTMKKDLKALLRRAETVDDLKVNPDYRRGDHFLVKKTETDEIALSTEQIKALEEVDISHLADGYKLARDLWMFANLTGFRLGDCKSFNPDEDIVELKGNLFIRNRQNKTGGYVYVPLTDRLKKYVKSHTISDVKTNLYIKTVAALAKIEESDRVSMHTARRSFCTNAYRADVPVPEIMKLSGHKTESAFFVYIKVPPEEYAMKAAIHPYFND